MTISLNDRFTPSSHAAYRNIGGQVVIVNTQNSRLLTLNNTASRIWLLLDGKTLKDVTLEMEKEFDVVEEKLSQDVVEFVSLVFEKGLVHRETDGT